MTSAPNEMHFKIHGMDCAEEVAVLKREVGPAVGGEQLLAFDILAGKMTVLGTTSATPDDILRAVARTGMSAEPWGEGKDAGDIERDFLQRHARTLLTALSGLFVAGGMLTHVLRDGATAVFREGTGVPVLSAILYGLAILAGSFFVLPKAWLALKRGRPDMNLLMTVAILGAVALGEWLEGATVAFLFALSLALEAWSVGRARRAIETLLDLAPPSARVLRTDGTEETVTPDRVTVGTLVLVRPGERIPLDGVVRKGISSVNQAPITGESIPVQKREGETVFAGTINGDGALEVESTKPAGETTLAVIVRMVGAASGKRAPPSSGLNDSPASTRQRSYSSPPYSPSSPRSSTGRGPTGFTGLWFCW